MKTLWERLGEDVKENMELDRGKYPNLVDSIQATLKREHYYYNLTVMVANYIYGYAYGGEPFDLMKYYNIFSDE